MAAPIRPLSDREMAAWRAYVETATDLTAALEADLAPTGMAVGDYQVLVFLSEAPDQTMRMVDLASRLQLTPSGLTRRLDGLVGCGFVTRSPSVRDRRVMLATLTDAGYRALRDAYPTHLASVRRRVIDLLEPDDVDALARIFGAIQAALRGNAVLHGDAPIDDAAAS
jgi:DNA-binding MarR family transcriptional regulator